MKRAYSLLTNEYLPWLEVEGKPWPHGSEPQRLIDYSGPYPKHELNDARIALIEDLNCTANDIIERVKPILGLTSKYGLGMITPECKRPAIEEPQEDRSQS